MNHYALCIGHPAKKDPPRLLINFFNLKISIFYLILKYVQIPQICQKVEKKLSKSGK